MADTFEGWAILELMGHRRLAGWLSEEQVAGAAMLRIDIPSPDMDPGDVDDAERPNVVETTQMYSAAAVYCITPVSADIACEVARLARPAPVQRWELEPAQTTAAKSGAWEPDEDGGE